MNWQIDARVVVVMDPTATDFSGPVAVLAEAELPEGLPADLPRAVFAVVEGTAHPAACLCCQGQGAAAAALAGLFRARALGGKWFTRVVAITRSEAGRAQLEEALTRDILTVARFRAE